MQYKLTMFDTITRSSLIRMLRKILLISDIDKDFEVDDLSWYNTELAVMLKKKTNNSFIKVSLTNKSVSVVGDDLDDVVRIVKLLRDEVNG